MKKYLILKQINKLYLYRAIKITYPSVYIDYKKVNSKQWEYYNTIAPALIYNSDENSAYEKIYSSQV